MHDKIIFFLDMFVFNALGAIPNRENDHVGENSVSIIKLTIFMP